MEILCISDCLELLPTVIEWERKEWGDNWADDVVRHATARDQVPTIYVAIKDDKPIGCAMLIKFDMESRHDLTPWLGGVFVLPEQRRQGVASALIRHTMGKARMMEIPTWWLYTESVQHLYKRLDWKEVENMLYNGKPVTIMRYDF